MSRRAVRQPRVARPTRIILALIVIFATAVAGFAAGWMLRPSPEAQRLAGATGLDVWAPVEKRAVGEALVFPGKASPGVEQSINVSNAVLEDNPVVLEMLINQGETVGLGEPLAIVSGQPYFALPEPLAMYRDLKAGDSGKDVESLQTALSSFDELVSVTGVIDYDTMQSIERMYQRADAHLGSPSSPTATSELDWQQRVIRKDAFLAVPRTSVVIATSGPGQSLTEETPLLKVRIGKTRVEAVIDVVSVDELENGMNVIVEINGQRYEAKIVKIGDFQPAKDADDTAGKPVSVEVIDSGVTVSADTPAKIVLGDQASESTLAVPLTAVRTNDSGQNYVIARKRGTDEANVEITVSIERTGSGYAAITTEGDELSTEHEVKVS